MQQQPPLGGQMMHAPMPPQNIGQAMPTGPPSHHQQMQLHQQQQQHQPHLGHHSQQIPSQQQHPGYHQIQSPHSHGSPVSHSGSPHPQQHHNHQPPLTGPPSQQASIPCQQHHMHPQSPHHHGGPPIHIQQQQQQQQLNQMVRPPLGPSVMNHPQSGLQHSPHHQNFFNGVSVPQSNIHHYPQQNQHHSHHQSQPQPQSHHHHHHQQQQHQQHHHHHHQPPPPLMHHAPPLATHHPHIQQSIGRSSPYYPGIPQTELRVIELNRRLQCRPISRHPVSSLPNNPYDESLWWERFASEFFDDDATLTLRVQDDKPVDYTIGRTLIPRFFRTYFDGGVTDLSINLRNPKEAFMHPQLITLNCDQAFIITNNIFKHPAMATNQGVVVHTEGHLVLDFVSNNSDTLLIKSWKFYTKGCREYIDRSMTNMVVSNTFLVEPVTRQGLTKSTIAYLKMCMIMEPMQDLMLQHRQTKMDPRSCLRKLLLDKYRYTSVDDNRVVTNKRSRKRKSTAAPALPGATTNKKSKAKLNNPIANNSSLNNNIMMSPSGGPSFPLASQDVMVVGEPSIMGGDFGDDNENTQYDPTASTPSNAEESDSMNTSAGNDNSVSYSTNIEQNIENHNMSPSLLQQRQQQQVPPPVQVMSQQSRVEQNSPHHEVEQHQQQQRSQLNNQDQSQDESTPVQINQPNLIDHNDMQQYEDIGQLPQHQPIIEEEKPKVDIIDEKPSMTSDPPSLPPPSQAPIVEKQARQVVMEDTVEKENNGSVLNDDTHMNSTATQSENNYNIINSIPEEREDTCRPTSCDGIISKLPPSSNNKNTLTINGSSNKQNRRRSSERKETLREGLMRTSDFVVHLKDLKSDHPALWRITTGNNLLQRFEPTTLNGVVLYENTNEYAGWNLEIKKDYVGVDVKLTQHARNKISVERLLLNFHELEDAAAFYDKHFAIYLQIIISTALDPKFWESIENESVHHDYFLTSRRIIEDITKRYKVKLSNKLKFSEAFLKNVEKYPNLVIKPVEKDDKEQLCRACNTNISNQIVSFGNRSYDLHSYKSVKVASELTKSDDKDSHNNLCDSCLELVKLYSEIHHMGWKLYNIAREKVDLYRPKNKPINVILDECLKDEDWCATIYAERDTLWAKLEQLQ